MIKLKSLNEQSYHHFDLSFIKFVQVDTICPTRPQFIEFVFSDY